MTPPKNKQAESQAAAEELPVSDGDTPPEDQVQGMATPEDLEEEANAEEGTV
jgi:hypothetical protein